MSTAANTGAALPKRLLICALGLLCYASGVAVTKNCELGISPIVSVAYVLSLITPITMGWCTTLVNLVFFLLHRLQASGTISGKEIVRGIAHRDDARAVGRLTADLDRRLKRAVSPLLHVA